MYKSVIHLRVHYHPCIPEDYCVYQYNKTHVKEVGRSVKNKILILQEPLTII